ncbi:MAG TPA: HPF/RaiA family ribosome-associated protein [Tepidisphaeraceae bacterium]|nr:HPF/RaiA family ribosome-associated protein [Tepidisphaeraceae bacterium]
MLIDTRAFGFELTDALLRHAEARVGAALGPAGDVARTTVRLDDVNGQNHGGPDKRCRIVAALRRHGRTVTVEATHADLYTAIDQAAHRAREATRRDGKRDLALARRPHHRAGRTPVPA